mmetsp:Transcript_19413/g.14090  ORF Transcript_19413/g.14090 Transcript_19413/m.14090 type:complete len:89 (+) Transcript_19413:1524-1790(+)
MKQESNPDEIKQSLFKELTTHFKLDKIERVHKDAIKSVTCVADGQGEDGQAFRYVTTSADGFIKMVDINEKEVKKAFFVNQSGINDAT